MNEEPPELKTSIIGTFVICLVAYLLILVVALTLAIGTGWLLRKIVPGLETGAAIIIGLLATAFSLSAAFKLFSVLTKRIIAPSLYATSPELAGDDEDDDEPPMVYAVPPFPARRRKFKRRPRQ